MKIYTTLYIDGLRRAGVFVRVPFLGGGRLWQFSIRHDELGKLRNIRTRLGRKTRKKSSPFLRMTAMEAARRILRDIRFPQIDLQVTLGLSSAASTAVLAGVVASLASALPLLSPGARFRVFPEFGHPAFHFQLYCITKLPLGKAIWDAVTAIFAVLWKESIAWHIRLRASWDARWKT